MRYLAVMLIIVLLVSGCKEKVAAPPPEAEFTVTGASAIMTSFNRPAIRVTIKNTGNATGYNVGVTIQAISGNTIVDTGHAFPGDLGNIAPGQSAVDDAVFFNLTNHSDYTRTETEIDWLTRD